MPLRYVCKTGSLGNIRGITGILQSTDFTPKIILYLVGYSNIFLKKIKNLYNIAKTIIKQRKSRVRTDFARCVSQKYYEVLDVLLTVVYLCRLAIMLIRHTRSVEGVL